MSEQPNEAKQGNPTPGPWGWQEANHTGVYETSRPRSLVSYSVRQLRQSDGKDLGEKPVLVCGARIAASKAHLIDDICLEIHGTNADEALIAAAPDLLAACEAILTGPVDEPQIDLSGEWQTGLFCGLEDRSLQADAYAACLYGFEAGVERVLEWAQGIISAAKAKGT